MTFITMKKHLLWLLIFFAFGGSLFGQINPLQLNIQINPPYSANYASYFQGPQQMVLTIVNNSTTTYSIYLAGSVATLDGSISVSTNADSPWPGAPLNVPPGSNVYTGADLQPFAENTNAIYTGITQQDVINGILPEGDYQVCLRAYNFNNQQPLSAAEPSGCSNTFTINYPAPPQLLTPPCESSLSRAVPQNIIFSWLPPTGLSGATIPHYRFTLVQVNDGVDAITALSNPTDPVFEGNDLVGTSLNYNSAQPILQSSRQYAWRVQAFDPSISPSLNQSAAFQNEGYSEPCTFTYLEPGASGNPFTLVFPLDGDTLPWDFMPIYQRFDPYSTDYIQFESDFTLYKNGSSLDQYSRSLSWPQGPELSQENALGVSLTQEQAQHINLYKTLSGVNPPAVSFTNGNAYSWDAQITLFRNNNTQLTGNLSGNFVSGMGTPHPIFPENLDTVTLGQALALRFQTSAPPQRLVPTYSILQSTNSGANFFEGGISQRWILEVSQSQSFSNILASQTKKLGSGLNYLNGTCVEQCLLDSLYREVSVNFTPNQEGMYYWRVRWLSDPNQTSGASYRDGPVWSFYAKNRSSAPPQEPVPPTPGECVSDCVAPLIQPQEKVAVNTATVGTNVTIGLFTMHITAITWASNLASGTGTINIPFMRAPIKVKFSGIKINSNNKVFEGGVIGEYDNTVGDMLNGISSSIASAAGSAASLSQSQTQSMNNLLAGFAKNQWSQLNGYLQSGGRLISQFTTDYPTGLPIGIDQNIDDQRVIIGVVGLLFTPETAKLTAMVSLDFPEFNGWLGLGATDICFHPNGIGGDGRAMLYLPSDHTIDFGESVQLRFDKTSFNSDYTAVADSGTYVSWDCNGFKALNVEGAVVFGRDLLVEDLSNGEPGPAQIEADFSCRVRRRGQWIAKLDFNHPFQIKGAAGWGFDVEDAWLDFSENVNPEGFQVPQGYVFNPPPAPGGGAGSQNYWKGFYLKRQTLKLPPQFTTYDNPGQRITANINNTLIDKTGFSASFRVENIVNVGDGDLGGWGFSMDTLMIEIVKNSFTRGGFVGKVRIPISDSVLVYSSMIKQNQATKNFSYQFNIKPKASINASLWVSTLSLANTSHILAAIDSSGASAKAVLNGNISINAKLGNLPRIQFELMGFDNLVFQTQAPYVQAGSVHFAFASPQKFIGAEETDDSPKNYGNGGTGGFPVSITNVGLTMPGGKLGIQFDLNLNLSGEVNSFMATTTLSVLGKFSAGSRGHLWEYDSIQLDSVGVSGSVGTVSLSGGLRFYNEDATYGNGIKGMINAVFKPNVEIIVAAQFGVKNNTRYWFADAQALFESKPIVAAPMLAFYGFGGGAWYNMKRVSPLPDASSITKTDTSGKSAAGSTLSGVVYEPDLVNKSFGFEARVILGDAAGGSAYNGTVAFGAQFYSDGGIEKMYLNGQGVFMREITDTKSTPQVKAGFEISYDFANSVFHAQLDVEINAAEGLVTGGGSAVFHVDKDNYYIHIGTPSNPINLEFAGLFKTTSYLMLGNKIEAPMPPPDEVVKEIGTVAPNFNTDIISSGGGFAFGARMAFDYGPKTFLILTGELHFGAGFDASLIKYQNTYCVGNENELIGINGWYASLDNLYAYISGKLSMHVDVWIYEGDYVIADLAAAFLLRAGLPNPSYLQGKCGGHYNILDGLVKGNYHFEFQLGEPCEIVSENPLAKVDILNDLIPHQNDKKVNCGIRPSAAFNLAVGKEFEFETPIPNAPNQYKSHRCKFVVDSFTLYSQAGARVEATLEFSEDGYSALILPRQYLDPYADYSVSINIHAEEFNFDSQQWERSKNKNQKEIVASLTHTFKTGPYPDRIPEENVKYTYPFNTQRYFLQGECRTGQMQMFSALTNLLTTEPNPGENIKREFYVRFTPVQGGPDFTETLEIDGTSLTFKIPSLQNNKVYACQFIAKDKKPRDISQFLTPIGGASSVLNQGANTSTQYMMNSPAQSGHGQNHTSLGNLVNQSFNTSYLGSSASSSGSSGVAANMASTLIQPGLAQIINGVQYRNNKLNGPSLRDDEKLLYVLFFKTSQFNTLEAKLHGFTNSSFDFFGFQPDRILLPGFDGPERFDVFDVKGFKYRTGNNQPFSYVKPIVSMTDARSDTWNSSYATPVIYDLYSKIKAEHLTNISYFFFEYDDPNLCFNRSIPDLVGIPPEGTVFFDNENPTERPLSQSEYLPNTSSIYSALSLRYSTILYDLPGYQSDDMRLKVLTGQQTAADYQKLQTIVNYVIWKYGNPYDSNVGYSNDVRQRIKTFLSYNGFRNMDLTTYGVDFNFNPPATDCGTNQTAGGFIIRDPLQFLRLRKSYLYNW